MRPVPVAVLMAACTSANAQVEVKPDALTELAGQWFGESLADDWEKGIVLQAGVPLGHVQALNLAGTEIDFAEFVALSGWAFSFSYKYGDVWPAFMAVRGDPNSETPMCAFGWLTSRLGYGFEAAPTAEKERLWVFVRKHIDAETPILSEHHDGGLITGYREAAGKREVWFAGSAFSEWVDIANLHPVEVCVLVEGQEAVPRDELLLMALERAARFASPGEGDPRTGLAAVEAFVGDMSDPEKTFEDCGDWFGWASLERLTARKCCAIWLNSIADELVVGEESLRAAAIHYLRAAYLYHSWRFGVLGLREKGDEQARAPEKVAALAPVLQEALTQETLALADLEEALAELRR